MAPSPALAHRNRRLALLVLTLGVFLVTVNVTIVAVALPAIRADLPADATAAAWIVDGYNLVVASLLLAAGFLADRVGRRRVLVASYALFALGAALCAVAPSAGALIAARVLQAIGGTALTPVSLALVTNLYPEPRERARAIGIWGVASGLGIGLGPVVGGGLAEGLGWRAVFAANGAVGLAAGLLVLRVVPSIRATAQRRFDLPGQALAALALATLTFALIEAPDLGWTSPAVLGLLALVVLLVGAFVAAERRAPEPLIDLRFFRDPQFSGAIGVTVGVFFVFGTFVFANALFLQEGRGYSPFAAGLLTLPAALPTLVGGPLAGRIVARRGPRLALASGTAGMALGVAILGALPGDAPLGALLAGYGVLGIGYAFVNAPISSVAVAALPRSRSAVAAALASTARNVGVVLGIAVAASVLAAADDVTTGVRPVYLLGAAVLVASTAVAVRTLTAVPPGATEG